MEDTVGFRIDGCAQPMLFAVEPDDHFVECHHMWRLTFARVKIGFVYPIVNGFSTPTDTKSL